MIFSTIKQILSLDWKKNPKYLSNRMGVYRLEDKQTHEIVYIGKSTDLEHRFSPSSHKVYDKNQHDIYVFFVDDKTELGKMEHRFIELIKPRFNTRRGQGKGYSEIELDKLYDGVFNQRLH